jgi:hypothetical protein
MPLLHTSMPPFSPLATMVAGRGPSGDVKRRLKRLAEGTNARSGKVRGVTPRILWFEGLLRKFCFVRLLFFRFLT